MEDIFNSQNILSEDEVANLFDNEFADENKEDGATEEGDPSKEEKTDTTEIDPESLFSGESESVGSGKDNEEGNQPSSKEDGTSPNLFSSIAKALKEEGIFPDLEDKTVEDIKKAEDFAEAVEKQIQARLDERQKRIDEALNVGVEPSAIQQYENTLAYLDKISEDKLSEESDDAENLRKQLIYQECINNGWSKERAQKVLEKSLANGTDVEDAKDALQSNKEFFKNKYNSLIVEAKEKEKEKEALLKEQTQKLKSSIFDDSKYYGADLSKAEKEKIYNSLVKPVEKDPETGRFLTAIQAYEKNNRIDFLRYVGYCFAMTNGFKDLDNLSKRQVKKEVAKGLKALESTLNNTQRDANGNLSFASGVGAESFFSKGFDLDV
jgi:hypothetical protein